ncbi:SDR family NAD(P)-dependent oxidoreductase [Nocardia yamanashiensis]|uniref:SDR family NAD(P)-dependent oxidoreductase n=1 Tax=Nocardia yamanashiensis TaxID=209247 RepID=UPI001E5C895E|nr:SDR family NAD(P)-dependent oxidoreductase [Nocardia yamanashiensis]UGT42601.1 SDR family NAD(P)-dependent oxidoreductase [Nocardia yamanashiensis]
MKPFNPQLAVVTGGGSGIGRGTAKALAAHGATLIIADIDLDAANDAVAEIRSLGGKAEAFRLDVADTPALEAFAEQVREQFGVPDVVVNNAGILVGGPFLDVPLEDLERIIDINLMAMIHGCRVFGQQMVDRGRGGHLVNIASMAAFGPAPYTAPYSIGKYAVKHFSECIRAEFASHGIGVTAICPGLISTNLAESTRAAAFGDEQIDLGKQIVAKGMSFLGMHPDKAGRQIVHAIRKNIAVEPIRLEARLSWPIARYFPGLVRAVMTVAATPDPSRLIRLTEQPALLEAGRKVAERMPKRSNHGVNV